MTERTMPTKFEVRFVPSTGAKRPYEIWAFWITGRSLHRGSFKTKEAALKSANERADFIATRGVSRPEVLVIE